MRTTLSQMRWISLTLLSVLTLTALTAHAQETITITQVDPSRFPEMVVYIDAEASKLPAGLTEEDFVVTEDGEPAEIIDFAGEGEQRPVDVVFVIDTTGSMGDEIMGVINTSLAFADGLRANNRDFRLGLVTFSDVIEVVRNEDRTLTADAEVFKSWVSELYADGGGDDPEISLDGLEAATQMHFRPDAQKVFILITDAPNHERGDGTPFSQVTPSELTTRLRDGGFTVYAAAFDHPHYHTVVNETSGKFYHLTPDADFIGIIDEIGGDIAKQYRLTYRSPRDHYDGTRRNLVISVGEQTGAEHYLEEHLIHIQSNPVIGILLLLPLVLALILPATLRRQRRSPIPSPATPTTDWSVEQVQPVPQPVAVVSPHPAPPGARCAHCGQDLRPDAKFCGHCGQTINAVAAPQSALCLHCGQPTRPGAKFCGACGQKL